MKKSIYDAVLIAMLLLALAVLFYKFLLFGMMPLNADWLTSNFNPWKADAGQITKPYFNNDVDPVLYMYPTKYITIKMMKQGVLPLWNPYILCGVPLWGNNFSTPLNPLNVVFFMFDFMKAWGIFLMLQFAVAGIGMYIFCIGRGMGRSGSSISALAYMLNMSFVIWFPTASYLGVYSWLPLVFLMIDKVFEHKSMLTAFWCGLTFALFFWSGLIQLAVYSLVFSLAYLTFRYFQISKSGMTKRKGYILPICIVLLTALFYSLPELMLQITNIMNSTRTPNRYGLTILYPQMLISYISPHFYGIKYDGWDLGFGTYIFNRGFVRLSPPYIGILPLFLAIIGFFTRKDKDKFFYLIFSAGILGALSLMALPVVYKPILKMIPFFNSVDHYRLTSVYLFSMSVMAGWGFNDISSDKVDRRSIRRITAAVFLSVLVIFILLQLLSYIDAQAVKPFLSSFENKTRTLVFEGAHSLKSVYKFVEYLNILNHKNTSLLLSPEVFIPMSFTMTAALIILWAASFKKKVLCGLAAFLFVAFDLLYYDLKFPAYSRPSNVYPATPTASFLAQDKTLHRIVGFSGQESSPYGDVYPPNTGMMYGLHDIRGYENIAQPRWLYRFMLGDDPKDIVINRIDDYKDKFISFLNVKYLISDERIEQNAWKLSYDREMKIYENARVMPRAFFAQKVLFAKDSNSAYRLIKKPSFDPFTEVVIEAEKKDIPYLTKGAKHESDPQIAHYSPNEVIIKTDGNDAGVLVLTDTYFPGWRVFVDGKERKLIRANYAFRAVFVKKGGKIIKFVFRPAGFYEILYLCFVLFAAAGIISFARLARRASQLYNKP